MGEADRHRWDERYAANGPPPLSSVAPPGVFARHADVFPAAGRALDLACGQGTSAVWLALRGLRVLGLDVSPVAIGQRGTWPGAPGWASGAASTSPISTAGCR